MQTELSVFLFFVSFDMSSGGYLVLPHIFIRFVQTLMVHAFVQTIEELRMDDTVIRGPVLVECLLLHVRRELVKFIDLVWVEYFIDAVEGVSAVRLKDNVNLQRTIVAWSKSVVSNE